MASNAHNLRDLFVRLRAINHHEDLGLSVKAINPFENCELAELLKGSLVYSLFNVPQPDLTINWWWLAYN